VKDEARSMLSRMNERFSMARDCSAGISDLSDPEIAKYPSGWASRHQQLLYKIKQTAAKRNHT